MIARQRPATRPGRWLPHNLGLDHLPQQGQRRLRRNLQPLGKSAGCEDRGAESDIGRAVRPLASGDAGDVLASTLAEDVKGRDAISTDLRTGGEVSVAE